MSHWHDDEPCDLTDKECDELMATPIKEKTMDFEKQTVWRTVSHLNSGGSFVWEVLEVVGGPITGDMKKFYIECRDGSFILIQCYHFFTSERVLEHMYAIDKFLNQELVIV